MELTAEKYKELMAIVGKEKERKAKEKRYWVKQQITLEKAKAAGITVTDAEVDARLKEKK